MIALGLLFALLLAAPQQNISAQEPTIEQARALSEQYRKAAIRINELAAQIHSEADAKTLVAQIAVIFSRELPPAWARRSILERVAKAEYKTVSNSGDLIPEQHIVNIWNEYVREIGAPEETLVTAAEIHNMRDGEFTLAKLTWKLGQQIWSVPNVYAVGSDGKVSADGCRAVEVLRVIYDLHALFQNLRSARDRVRQGIVPSDEVAKRLTESNPRPKGTIGVLVGAEEVDPVRMAEYKYVKEHGSEAFSQLLWRLFDELFPPN
jgi:hypothetical protein